MNVTVEHVARFSSTPATPLVAGIPTLPAKAGWEAKVQVGPDTLFVSRLDGEDAFMVDGLYRGSLFPRFFNGTGARFCMVDAAPKAVQAALVARLG